MAWLIVSWSATATPRLSIQRAVSLSADRCIASSRDSRVDIVRLLDQRPSSSSLRRCRGVRHDRVDRALESTAADPEGPGVVVGECPLEQRAQRPWKSALGDDDLIVDDLDPVWPFAE